MNRSNTGGSPADTVNIEHVMQEVRREILDRKLPGQVRLPPASSGSQPPEYYEELFRAALAQSRVEIDLLVTPTRVPIIGPIVDFLRSKFHELVVFYINRSAMNQAKVNNHILAALSILGQAGPPDGVVSEQLAAGGDIQNQPATLDDVRAAYRLFLGRQPEPAETESWTQLLAAPDVTRRSLIDSFLRQELPAGTGANSTGDRPVTP